MAKEPFGLSDEMKNLYKVLGEIATSGLPDISKTIGSNLLNTVSEFSAMTASLGQSTSWIVQPDVLKPIIGALEWANNLPIQHAFDEIKRAVESPQYQAVIKGMATFAKDFDWQWLADLQTKYDGVQTSTIEEIAPQITEEETKQFCEDFNEVVESAKHGVAVVEGKFKELNEKYPLLVQIILMFLSIILSQFFSQPAITTTNSNIYLAPVSNSKIVYQTTINQTINIIGDAPYYYNVQLIDSQTGDEYQGYIYKKNVSVDSPTIEDDTASNETPPSVNDEIESSQTEDDATTE